MRIDHRSASTCPHMSRRCRYGLSDSMDAHGHTFGSAPSACGCQSRIGTAWHSTSLPVGLRRPVLRDPKTCPLPFSSNFLVDGKRSKDSSPEWFTQYRSASLVVYPNFLDAAPIVTACKNTREMSLLQQAPLKPEAAREVTIV